MSGNSPVTLPMMPGTNSIGAKAAMVVSTPKVTGASTSSVPRTAALVRFPVRTCVVWMFSPTTMASSTTMPSTKMNANSEIILIDWSNSPMQAIAPRNEIGMPRVTQNANRMRRNRVNTTKTSTKPERAFLSSRLMRPCSSAELSCRVAKVIPAGSVEAVRAT